MDRKTLRLFNSFEWLKNSTPHRLALINGFLLGIIALFISLFTSLFCYKIIAVKAAFITAILIAITTYLLFYWLLEYFIYRKIKLIYKIIRKQKRPQTASMTTIDMNTTVIEDAEAEVAEWVVANENALAEFKKMEIFRREYLGNISHELKTPIFILQGYLDTLLNGGINDPKVSSKYLQKAAKNADRLQQIVCDLDFISEHEAGRLVLQKTSFNIFELVREIIDDLQLLANNSLIKIEIKEGSSTTVAVFADREKIRQVLTNLVTNSIKYGREHGTTSISIYDMHREVLIEVSDNGIGIAQEHLTRLFERFYRVDSSRTRARGGSGLGLAIAKHIMEAHKRQIHVRSQIGVGTTFGFSLKKSI